MLENIFELANQYQDYLIWLGIASSILFIVGIITTPFLIGMIPEDYFADREKYKLKIQGPMHLIWVVIRSIFGFILLLAGVIMLFTPGQGILSIVLGIFLMEFPGKQKLEYKMIQHDPTFNAINWLRSKAGKDALRR